MATDMSTGGDVNGAACTIVIWAVGIDGGTKVICGGVGMGEVGAIDEACERGGPP